MRKKDDKVGIKTGLKNKGNGKKGRLAGSSSTSFLLLLFVCLFLFFAVYLMIIKGSSWIFTQTRSQLKRWKTGESSREGSWEGGQSEFVNFVCGRTRTDSAVFVILACTWLLLVLLIGNPTQSLLLRSVRQCYSQLSPYHFNVFSVNIRVTFRTS